MTHLICDDHRYILRIITSVAVSGYHYFNQRKAL